MIQSHPLPDPWLAPDGPPVLTTGTESFLMLSSLYLQMNVQLCGPVIVPPHSLSMGRSPPCFRCGNSEFLVIDPGIVCVPAPLPDASIGQTLRFASALSALRLQPRVSVRYFRARRSDGGRLQVRYARDRRESAATAAIAMAVYRFRMSSIRIASGAGETYPDGPCGPTVSQCFRRRFASTCASSSV